MVKTAVIMATYNGTKLLPIQLDSIRDQSIKADYVLFRDDCSSDETVKYLEEYIQKNNLVNWIVQINEKNMGWKKTFRQLMIDSLSYDVDYVFFSDQDDQWMENKIEEQLKVASAKPEIEVLSCDFDVKNVKDATYGVGTHNFEGSELLSQYPKRFNYIAFKLGFTYMIKSSFIRELIPAWQDDALNIAHDRTVTLLSNLCGTGYNINQVLATHIYHGDNVSGRRRITIHSHRSDHLLEIQENSQYYLVAERFLEARGYGEDAKKARKYYDFYMRRYTTSKKGNIFLAVIQILRDWKMYFGMETRARDLLFAIKK